MGQKIVAALAGNPNSGKTTVFNNLTGARQHVGNYPGVTVECKRGYRQHDDSELEIVDLPGIYSLTAYSAEELVARDFIIEKRPDVVVNIIDASNLERNLYLTVQLMELKVPLVLVFNMSDQARARGHEFDIDKLSRFFRAPIVQTVGHKGGGMSEVLDSILEVASGRGALAGHAAERNAVGAFSARASIRGARLDSPVIDYGREIEEEIAGIEALLDKDGSRAEAYDTRWLAVKLLENDEEVRAKVSSAGIGEKVAQSAARIERMLGESPETAIAGRRYGFISGACQEAVRSTIEIRHTMSDRIDAVVTSRILGIPIFLALMYLVFNLTFTLGEPPMGWIEDLFGRLGAAVASWWPDGAESPLKSLLVDGVIGGVGGVVIFLPNILLLFLAIAILEDTGYMARAAFIMDRVMHKIGLHGKSFIPMLIGFGCSVPAIMATRTLENRRDRIATMLVVPLMSCGARLPIYALIIPAFFPEAFHAPMLWTIYVIGILLAVLSTKLLRSTILKGESVPFVMELPPYRMPTVKSVLIHMWERGWLYLKKAGTVILAISIVLWAMTSYPKKTEFERDYGHELAQAELNYHAEVEGLGLEAGGRGASDLLIAQAGERLSGKRAEIEQARQAEEMAYSIAGRAGHALEPLLKPMGFDWRIGTALIGAFAAKEVFVAQMGIVYSVGEADEESETLREKLTRNYTPLVGFCIMLFCLISAPCMATIAVTRRESNSWKWALFQLAGLTILAFVVTTIVYQTGMLFGLGVV